MIVGANAAVKSSMLTELLDQIEERGEKAIVVDAGGEFCKRYYQEGRDHILNPFEDRSVPWSPIAEIKDPSVIPALVKSMIPDGKNEAKVWNCLAQIFVRGVLSRLQANDNLSLQTLLYYVQAAPKEELADLPTEAAWLMESDAIFGSVRTIAATYLAAYAYLGDSKDTFSVTKFVTQDAPGFVFLTYRDDQLDSLRNLMACALDVASLAVLGQEANTDRRIWLILNDFTVLGKIQSLETLATRSRKKGAYLVLSLASLSDFTKRYGEDTPKIIYELSHKLNISESEQMDNNAVTLANKAEAFMPRDFKKKPMLQLAQ